MSYRIRGWQKTSEVFHDMERATDKILEADLELKKEFGDLPRRSKIASYCKGERKASTVQTILDKFFTRNKTLIVSVSDELNYSVLNYKY